MGSFRDTFAKEEREKLLGYDDSASLYFGGCVLVLLLVPLTIRFIRKVFYPTLKNESSIGKDRKTCQCHFCGEARLKVKKKALCLKTRILNGRVLTEFLVLFVLTGSFFHLLDCLRKVTSHIQAFDPYEILGVSRNADAKDIKKSYRTLSLKYHPDRNPNSASAASKFILISKAYQSLNDEVAKQNFEKYGNPDGPGLMKIGIGLPKFLLDDKYQFSILLLLFVILLIVIPTIFIFYYHKEKTRSYNGLLQDTIRFLVGNLTEGTKPKNMTELVAVSMDAKKLDLVRPSDNVEMRPVLRELRNVLNKKKHVKSSIELKIYYLLNAHFQRLHHLLSGDLTRDLDHLLDLSFKIIQCLLEISSCRGWIQTFQSVIDFRRALIQAVDVNCITQQTSFMQIPHFTAETAEQCLRGKNCVKDFRSFVLQDPQKRKGLAHMTQEQIQDVHNFCSSLPVLDVQVTASVADEENFIVGDVVSVTVTLTRTNLKENQKAGAVHAPYFPKLINEEWWILIFSPNNAREIRSLLKVDSNDPRSTETLTFSLNQEGSCCYTVKMLCSSYFGLDVTKDITFKVLPESKLSKELYVHPRDVELDEMPSLLQQILGEKIIENPVSSEGDEEEEEEESPIDPHD